jgi:hypothetical protein
MTVNTSAHKVEYTGNGTTDTFAVSFQCYQIVVYVSGVLKTQGTHYVIKDQSNNTVADCAGLSTNSVVFLEGHVPASAAKVVIYRDTTRDQPTDYRNFDDAPADLYEKTVDKLEMQIQELSERVSRSLRASMLGDSFPELDFKNSPGTWIKVNDSGVPELVTQTFWTATARRTTPRLLTCRRSRPLLTASRLLSTSTPRPWRQRSTPPSRRTPFAHAATGRPVIWAARSTRR